MSMGTKLRRLACRSRDIDVKEAKSNLKPEKPKSKYMFSARTSPVKKKEVK